MQRKASRVTRHRVGGAARCCLWASQSTSTGYLLQQLSKLNADAMRLGNWLLDYCSVGNTPGQRGNLPLKECNVAPGITWRGATNAPVITII